MMTYLCCVSRGRAWLGVHCLPGRNSTASGVTALVNSLHANADQRRNRITSQLHAIIVTTSQKPTHGQPSSPFRFMPPSHFFSSGVVARGKPLTHIAPSAAGTNLKVGAPVLRESVGGTDPALFFVVPLHFFWL